MTATVVAFAARLNRDADRDEGNALRPDDFDATRAKINFVFSICSLTTKANSVFIPARLGASRKRGIAMKFMLFGALSGALFFAVPAEAQTVLPADTTITVAPVNDITSKQMKEGDEESFQVVNDVTQNGVVVIPRGASVKGKITWRTGRGIVGKSAKFEVAFVAVNVGGRAWALKGKHRQEGKGNTVAALLGSMIISGHSAVMLQGQGVPALTAEPITAS